MVKHVSGVTKWDTVCRRESWRRNNSYRQSLIRLGECLLDSTREQLQACFGHWVKAVSCLLEGEVVAIDGKTLRHSDDKNQGKGAIHMVSAWASANRLVLGQKKVEEKSNEITAIPELLEILDLAGCIVTIDASGLSKRDCLCAGGAKS